MDDAVIFTAKCQKCGQDATCRYDRERTRELLAQAVHIELYCGECGGTRNLDSEERMQVSLKLRE